MDKAIARSAFQYPKLSHLVPTATNAGVGDIDADSAERFTSWCHDAHQLPTREVRREERGGKTCCQNPIRHAD